MYSESNLVWVDLEMTGLDPERERIIEIAIIVTDSNLNTLAEAPVFAIHQNDALLAGMDAWNQKHHTRSGLVDRVKKSEFDEAKAEELMLKFLKQYVPEGASPICGNSVWHDKRFLSLYMPKLATYFHYRVVDVSTIKELAKRWRPDLLAGIQKSIKHEALADIRESIAELQYYRQHFLSMDSTAKE